MGNSNSEETWEADSSDILGEERSYPKESMDEIVCEVCIQNYDSKKIVPRVLECGHTFCVTCIEELLNSSNLCPKCRVSMQKKKFESYPVNYSLLGVSESLRQNKPTILEYRIDKLTKKYSETEVELSKNLSKTERNLSCVAVGLIRLKELGKQLSDHSFDHNSTSQILVEMNDQLDVIRNETKRAIYDKDSVNIKLRDFADSTEFLFEIYNRAAEGEKLFAVTIFETEVKFAKISVFANRIIIHAFGPCKDNPNYKTIWFHDIKSCLGVENFKAFLEICCNDQGMRQVVVIKTSNSSLVPQFLKFCTGEIGPLYKGACYFQGSPPSPANYTPIVNIPKFVLKGDEQTGNHDYVSNLGLENALSYEKKDVLLTGSADGGLQIIQLLFRDNIPNVIGKIEEPIELSEKIIHGNNRRITNSGIIAFV